MVNLEELGLIELNAQEVKGVEGGLLDFDPTWGVNMVRAYNWCAHQCSDFAAGFRAGY